MPDETRIEYVDEPPREDCAEAEAEIAALRARLEAAEQGEAKAWGCYANSETVNRELADHLAKTERKLAAAEASSIRLAQALLDVGGQDATGDRICWCDGGPEHAPECDDARTALAEHDGHGLTDAVQGEGS